MGRLLEELRNENNSCAVTRIHKSLHEILYELEMLKKRLSVDAIRKDDPVYEGQVREIQAEIDSTIANIQNKIDQLYICGKAPRLSRRVPYVLALHQIFEDGSDPKYVTDNPNAKESIIIFDLQEEQSTCPRCSKELSPASLVFHTYKNEFPMKNIDSDKIVGTYILDTKYCSACNCHYCDTYELFPELEKYLGEDCRYKSDLEII